MKQENDQLELKDILKNATLENIRFLILEIKNHLFSKFTCCK